MGIVDTMKQFWMKLVGYDQNQVQWTLKQANNWRLPSATKYLEQVNRRRFYLDGDMSDDGDDFLKQEFPKTWETMRYKKIEFPIAQNIVKKKAQTFRGRGARFYLLDNQTGKEVTEGEYKDSFDEMMARAYMEAVLPEIDQAEEMMLAAAGKVTWDQDHLELYCFDPDRVHIAVNPLRENDPYSALAVMFERAGVDGYSGKPRYEFWGVRDPKTAKEKDVEGNLIFDPTLHYIASAEEPIDVNDGDVNPFEDRHTGKPIYPFTWFRSNRNAIYKLGGDQLVSLNRVVNLGLTYLHHNATWQMAVLPVFEVPAGQKAELEKLKQTILSAPNKAVNLPAGVKLSFVAPNGEVQRFQGLYEFFVQYHAMLNQLSPKSLDIKGGIPTSGIAMRIEFDNLIRYFNERTEILRPHVLNFIEKCLVVWNYYAPHIKPKGYKAIPSRFVPEWDPGQMDSGPVDYVEIGNRYSREIEVGVSSVDEWCADVHKCDLETAKERVNKNLARLQEVRKQTTRYPEEETDGLRDAVEGVPVEGEEKPEKEPAGKAPEKSGAGAEAADSDKLMANVYQIVKAIEVGAATAVDLRMLLYPEETRQQAEQQVRENLDFNLEVAELTGQAKAVEEKIVADAKRGKEAEPTPDQKKAGEKLQKFVDGDEGDEDEE